MLHINIRTRNKTIGLGGLFAQKCVTSFSLLFFSVVAVKLITVWSPLAFVVFFCLYTLNQISINTESSKKPPAKKQSLCCGRVCEFAFSPDTIC